MDTISESERSRVMAAVRQRDSKLELAFRSHLWATGARYRIHVRMFGTPDISIKSLKLVTFIDSCFWHGCPEHCRQPKSNRGFWHRKLLRNRNRDTAVTAKYISDGWIVLRFWEHDLLANLEKCVRKASHLIQKLRLKSKTASRHLRITVDSDGVSVSPRRAIER